MRAHDRYDEYEDLDEYEEDGDEQEEKDAGEDEYEEEDDPKPAKEVLNYLELRQRLKEEKRKKLKKELGTANGSSREKKNVISKDVISKDTYGSFFGPSQPVIAQRVIEESKSLLENPDLAARVIKFNQSRNKSSGSASSVSKSQAGAGPRPKVTNGLQKKVEMLKNTRDYSFLLADDAELPVPKKVPHSISAQKPEARSAQLSERSRDSLSINGQKVSSSREDKKPTAAINRMQPKVGSEKFGSRDKLVRPSVESGKHLSGNNGALADHRKQPSISNGSGPGRPVVSKSVPTKPISNGSGPGRPLVSKSVPPKPSVSTSDKKASVPVARTSAPGIHKPNPSKVQTSVSKQSSARKEEHQAPGKPKILPKQPIPPLKPKQVLRPPPKPSARDASRGERPRKRPVRHNEDDEDDPETALRMIRNMFGYNPSRYEDVDDDSDMEANFDDIQREEKRSARIARQEDEEELRKIEEEERRERLHKEAKKRKLSHR
ncbi:protein SPT2 homolog [Coffea eugenioides]|uniref:protein SPT2 homolog n=1 Tax=Coffea eugenioides TaxID=49369 RepID=UPI000F60CC95|nr:protein SPT2 homolog [Coffea eugenioides]XP_027178677.1 protein SPT2 homolog [Coffea eugenioides]XP_027178678.1 protein SPT2 homolog [Coffea eugenioides]